MYLKKKHTLDSKLVKNGIHLVLRCPLHYLHLENFDKQK